jgi:quercetin dioxygenase-like cupin family protein
MNLIENFKVLGSYNINSILSKIQGLDQDWDEYTFRQERYKDHSETKTIPLIWSEKFNSIEKRKWYNIFENELEELEFIFNSSLEEGVIISAILINLPKGKSIKRHIDANPIGERFNQCHRIHIPITTNENCIFEINGEEKSLKPGEIWEISNVFKPHSVRNEGDCDRIHLLIDWMPLEIFKNL